jgi:hypothetical protein
VNREEQLICLHMFPSIISSVQTSVQLELQFTKNLNKKYTFTIGGIWYFATAFIIIDHLNFCFPHLGMNSICQTTQLIIRLNPIFQIVSTFKISHQESHYFKLQSWSAFLSSITGRTILKSELHSKSESYLKSPMPYMN